MKLQLIIFFCLSVIANTRFVNRIIGGRNVERGSFPNVVRVRGHRSTGVPANILNCGGVIYNDRWIAVTQDCVFLIHYFYPKKNIRVIAGEWNRTEFQESVQMRAVVLTVNYSDYDRSSFGKSVDLGLLKLDRALDFGKYVTAFKFSTNTTYPSGRLIMVSWGSTTLKDARVERIANIAQVIEVDAMSRDQCDNALSLWDEGEEFSALFHFSRLNFCIGTFTPNTRGAAYGDGGGAVMQIDEENRYKVIGIIRFGFPTIDLTVITPVTYFIDWIDREIAAHSDP